MEDVNKIKTRLLKLKKEERVLDVGCSHGEQALMLAKKGFVVTGIDISKKLIEKLNNTAKNEKLNCSGVIGNIEKMPFKNNYFSAIVATEILEHIKHPDKAAQECFRVLKKNGIICVSVPTESTEKIFSFLHPNWVKHSGHINVFSKKQIINLLTNSGFKVIKTENQNFEWSIFWLIHSFLKTKFNDTGSPSENEKISQIYFKIWNYLYKLRLGKGLMMIGNYIFPKSVYIYLVKP